MFEKDRILKYFERYLATFLFVEFSDEFMKKLKIDDIAKDIKVPIKAADLDGFAGGEGVSATKIAENMILVMGLDPNFKYNEAYKQYIKRFFKDTLLADVLMAGMESIKEKDFDMAAVHFRACIAMKEDFLEALYNYARVCREIYIATDSEVDEEKKGRFKAEMIDVFEEITIVHPNFAEPYYFLAYAYLNMGMYIKSGVSFEKYISLSKDEKGKEDAREKLANLADPRRIEEGSNAIISGDYEKGISILMPYLNSNYATWWPLHFYLATAFEEVEEFAMAELEYRKTLELNASLVDAIDGLIRIYSTIGDEENLQKYMKKKNLVLNMYS